MAGFRMTVQLNIEALNMDSALKKLVKALYGGRSHFDSVTIRAECFREVGGMAYIREGDLPTDLPQWKVIALEKLARLAKPTEILKKDDIRAIAADLQNLADRLNGRDQ